MLERMLFSALSPGGPRARLTTLIFHRVFPQPDPLFPGEIDAVRFDALCSHIARWFRVMPLGEAVERLDAGTLPSRAMAITFDDGYADNLDIAVPILRKHGLTATFFIATGFLDGGRMWNDTVIESIRRTDALKISLDVGDRSRLELALGSLSARRAAIDAVLRAVKHLPPDKRLEACNAVRSQCDELLPDDLMLTSTQVRQLVEADMQVGAHTVSHPILAILSEDEAEFEMMNSRKRLEELTGRAVDLFAYPNGYPGNDYGLREVKLARRCGFFAAMSTARGVASSRTDRFQLPRFTPWHLDGWRFPAQLAGNLLRQSPPAAS